MSEGGSFYRLPQRRKIDLDRMDKRNLSHFLKHQFCLICNERIVGKYWIIKEGFARGEKYACTRCANQVAVVQRAPSAPPPPPSGYLYCGLDEAPAGLVKINTGTLSRVGAVVFASGEDYADDMLAVAGFMYVGVDTDLSCIVKTDLSTLLEVASLTVGAGIASAMATDGSFLYVALDSSPVRISKIDLGTFTETAHLDLANGQYDPQALLVNGSSLYLGSATGSGDACVTKIDLGTFTETANITRSGCRICDCLATLGSYLYAPLNTSPTIIKKIDLASFTETDSLTLNSGEDYARCCAIISSSLYVGLGTTMKIVKVDLTSFTETSALSFGSGESSYVSSLAVNASMLYAVADAEPPSSYVYAVDTSTFTVSGIVSIPDGALSTLTVP